MPDINKIFNTSDFILGRLANFTNTAEGSFLPPPQRGQARVPFVSGLQIIDTQPQPNLTTFTLSWLDVPSNSSIDVDHYNLYYITNPSGSIPGAIYGTTSQPVGPFTAQKSPATMAIPSTAVEPITFMVQTVLTNGMTSELALSPTVSGFTNPALIVASGLEIVGLTLTNNSPGAGQIAWSACTVYYNGIAYTIAAGNTSSQFVTWTIGASTFVGISSPSFLPGPTVFLVLTNTGGIADTAWNKLASGGVDHTNLFLPQVSSGPNGTLITDLTWTNNTPIHEITWSAGQISYQGITYTIPTGHTSATFYVYWQLSNPSVLQTSVGPPSLGVNDFIVAFNTTDNSGASGIYAPVTEEHNSNGDRTVITPGFIAFYNSSGNLVTSFARANAAFSGIWRLADGTGAGSLGSGQKIIATGTDGKIQMGTFEVNPNNSGSVFPSFLNMALTGSVNSSWTGYLNVTVDGTARKIPFL